MRYVEFCAGIGGTRAGLDAAGWECVLGVDHDADAVAVHRLAFGSLLEGDVTKLSSCEVPEADVWVAGFPCQPFSSSGSRIGFEHRSGNVFEHLARMIAERLPTVLVLENVEGLLSNKAGHTFATIVSCLTQLGYEVDWLVIDLRWFRVPQSRPRLFIVAAQPRSLLRAEIAEASGLLPGFAPSIPFAFASVLEEQGLAWRLGSEGSLSETVRRLSPAIGKAQPTGRHVFRGMGHARGDHFASYDLSAPLVQPEPGELSAIVAPEFRFPETIRSARYWSPKGGGGPEGLHVREEALSHCVGTSLGGAPLFAVPNTAVSRTSDRTAFLRFSDWHREQNGLLVMRLCPERTVLLFGAHTEQLSQALGAWKGGATRKFRLVGNMVAPICAKRVADLVNAQFVGREPVKAQSAHPKGRKPERPLSRERDGVVGPEGMARGKRKGGR